MTNAEKPDLVLLTGDFVCHSQLYLDQLTQVMRAFKAPVIAVLGNHDHWSGADEVRRALERGGVEVLCNRHTTITLRHERLQVVGLDDAYTGHARRDEAVKGLRHDLPTHRSLAHRRGGRWPLAPRRPAGAVGAHARRPGHARAAARVRGRQASAAIATSTASTDRAATRTTAPDDEPAGAVYVGAGIGAAVVPFRFGDRGKREVTMFELGCEPGDFVEHHAEQEPLKGRKPTQRTIAKRAAAVLRKRLRRERRALSAALRGCPLRLRRRWPCCDIMAKYTLPICPTTTALSSRTSRETSCSSTTTSITRAYVTGANDALDGLADARAKNDFSQIAALERALAFNVVGARAALAVLAEPGARRRAASRPARSPTQMTRDFGEFARSAPS